MQTCVQKWGNSYGIRIPQHIMRQLNLYQGSIIDLKIEENRIVIDTSKYNALEEMLSKITDENTHKLILEDSYNEGTEAW